jgi:starch synthase
VKSAVESVLSEQGDYLRLRLNAPRPAAPLQLPVIPLGVQCNDFTESPSSRATIRQRLGVSETDVLVLYAARLSFHAKAHPYPMYLALQQAAERTGARVHLLLAGWFNSPFQENVFREGAAELCPDVTLHVLDGREPGVWDQIWHAADIYTLLSDNIQESFGLSPVEAMAAGLPVVGSDWNGLKDTIAHNQTGFLVPTLAPPPGSGTFMSQAYDSGQMNYDQYVGATAQAVSVDVAAAAAAFTALIADSDLRRRIGAAARARALADYDWPRVISQYQALWSELAARRSIDAETAPLRPGRPGNPARSDPYRTFAAYPTRFLALTDRIAPMPGLRAAAKALADRPGVAPVRGVVLAKAELDLLVDRMSACGAGVADIVKILPDQPPARVLRTLTWLHKHGLITLAPARPAQA